MKNFDLRGRIGSKGSKTAKEKFALEKMIDSYEKLLMSS